MRQQLSKSTLGLALALGAALALIYGTLSLLEFQQSRYISALLNSLGASRLLLFLRTIGENLLIVNLTAVILIFILQYNHSLTYTILQFKFPTPTATELTQLYWGIETRWLLLFVNLGVLLSCIPVLLAMRKQVGRVLN